MAWKSRLVNVIFFWVIYFHGTKNVQTEEQWGTTADMTPGDLYSMAEWDTTVGPVEDVTFGDQGNMTYDTYPAWFADDDTTNGVIDCSATPSPCLHGGTCGQDKQNVSVCYCSRGFYGNACQHVHYYLYNYPDIEVKTHSQNKAQVMVNNKTLHTFLVNYTFTDEISDSNPFILTNVISPIEVGQHDYYSYDYSGEECGPAGATFSVWIKLRGAVGEKCLLTFDTYLTNGYSLRLTAKGSDTLLVEVGSCGLLFGPVTLSVEHEYWYNLIVTANGNGVKVYANGQLVSSLPNGVGSPFDDTTQYDLTLMGGCVRDSDGQANVTFRSIGFWGVDMNSDATIEEMYAATARKPNTHFLFDKVEEGLIYHKDPKITEGFVKNALNLDGEEQWVETNETTASCLNNLDLCERGLTLMVWIRPTRAKKSQGYLHGAGINLGLITGRMHLRVSGSSISTDILDSGLWHHIAIVYDARSRVIQLYVNGEVSGLIVYRKEEGYMPYQMDEEPAAGTPAPDYYGGRNIDSAFDGNGNETGADSYLGNSTNAAGSPAGSPGDGTNFAGLPDNNYGNGTHLAGLPDNNYGNGTHLAGLPDNNLGNDPNVAGLPDNNQGYYPNVAGLPDNNQGYDPNVAGLPDNNQGNVTNVAGLPDNNQGNVTNVAGLPVNTWSGTNTGGTDPFTNNQVPARPTGWYFGQPQDVFTKYGRLDFDEFRLWDHNKPDGFVSAIYKSFDDKTCLFPSNWCVHGGRCNRYRGCQCKTGFNAPTCRYTNGKDYIVPEFAAKPRDSTSGQMVFGNTPTATFPVTEVRNGSYGDPYMVFNSDNKTYTLGEYCENCCDGFSSYDASMTYTLFFKLLGIEENSTGCIMSSNTGFIYGLSVVVTDTNQLQITVDTCKLVFGPFTLAVQTSRWYYLAVVGSKNGIRIFLDGKKVVNEPLKAGTHTDVNTGYPFALLTGCDSTNQTANVAFKSVNVWWFEMQDDVIEYMGTATETEPCFAINFEDGNQSLALHGNPNAIEGVSDNAISLNGKQQWFGIPRDTESCLGDYEKDYDLGITLMMWIRPHTIEGSQGYFSGGGLEIGLVHGRLCLSAQRGKTTWGYLHFHPPLTANQWYHVTITQSPNILNGRFQVIVKDTYIHTGHRPKILEVAANYTTDWSFGAPNELFTEYGNVDIDEVLLWNHNKIYSVVANISGKYYIKPEPTTTTLPTTTTQTSTTKTTTRTPSTTTESHIVPRDCLEVTMPGDHSDMENALAISLTSTLSVKANLRLSENERCTIRTITLLWTISNATWGTNSTYDITFTRERLTAQFSVETKLSPGTYRIECRTFYINETEVLVSDYMYVSLRASPLEAKIQGGTVRTFQKGTIVKIDAIKGSSDPDLSSKRDKTGMTFSWRCTQLGSNGDVTGSRTSVDCATVMTSESTPEEGVVYINTRQTGKGYFLFNVTLSKGTRTAHAWQTLMVVDGFVPNVTVSCLMNCDTRVVPGRKLSLMAGCSSCSPEVRETLTYTWIVYKEVSGSRQEVNDQQAMLATGSTGSGLVVRSGTLEVGVSYCIQLQVACQVCEDSMAEYCFTTNQPPEGGTCNVTPETGEPLTTEFVISCANWTHEGDANAPLMYRYDVLSAGGTLEPVYTGSSASSPGLRLAAGSADGDYKVKVIAAVYDQFGGFAETRLTIEVKMAVSSSSPGVAEKEALMESVSTLTQGSSSVLGEMMSQGDNSQAAQLISAVAGVLNGLTTESSSSTSESNSDQGESNGGGSTEELKELRETLITQVASMSSQVKTPDGVRVVTQALRSTTDVTGQVSDSSMAEATSALSMLLNTSTDLMADSPEQALTLGEPLLGVVGNMLRGAQPDTLTTVETNPAPVETSEDAPMSPEEQAFLQGLKNKKINKKIQADKDKAAGLTPNLLESETTLLRALAQTMAPGEDALLVTTTLSAMSVQRRQASDMGNETTVAGGVAMTFGTAMSNNDGDVLDVSATSYKENPYPWMADADKVTSDVFSLSLTDQTGSDVSLDDDVTLQFSTEAPAPTFINVNQSEDSNSTADFYHKFELDSADSAFMTRLQLDGEYAEVSVYVRRADDSDFGVREVVQGVFDGNVTTVNIAIAPSQLSGVGTYYMRVDPIISNTSVNSRQRRSLQDDSNSTDVAVTSYAITMTTSVCRTLDTATNTWTTDGCEVGTGSTVDTTDCRCRPSSNKKSFGVSFFAPPNLIDFSTVWAKFANIGDNAAVLSTVVSLLVLYFLLLVWARWEDKKDTAVGEVRDLADNRLGDTCMYVISVETGYKMGAGTSAHVQFVISGTTGDTGVRHLAGTEAVPRFPSGKVRTFYLTTPAPLGQVTTLAIWHDGIAGGRSNAWYLNKVTVEDLSEKKVYTFLCHKWLAIDRGDGHVARTLHAAPRQETTRFSYLLGENSKIKLAEHHMWASVFYQPRRNNFSRVQRLSCCLCYLFLSMITSAMFYKTEDNVERPQVIRLGPLSFSTQEFFVSVITVLIVLPVNLIILQLFRKTADVPSCSKSGRVQDQELLELDSRSYTPISEFSDSSKSTLVEDTEKGLWPGGLRVVAWLLLVLAVLPSAFFVILYSMEWGTEKSNQWLTAFFLTFVEEAALIDPLKVFMIALFLTYLLRKTAKEEADDEEEGSQAIETPVPDLTEEEQFEKRRLEELTRKESRALARDVIMVCLLGVAVFGLCFVTTDPKNYAVYSSLKGSLLDGSTGFTNYVSSPQSYFNWLRGVFIPGYFVETDINGEALPWRERRLLADRAANRIGPARIRQTRRTLGVNTLSSRACLTNMEDRSTFGLDLIPEGQDEVRYTSGAWTYVTSPGSMSYEGRMHTYSRGGYICDLDINQNISAKMADELFTYSWIDRNTHSIVLEFTVYNANVNLFARAALLAEFAVTGQVLTSAQVEVFRVHAVGANGVISQVFEVLFALVTLYNLIMMGITLFEQRCRPGVSFSFIMDVCVLLNSLYLISIYTLKVVTLNRTMAEYKADRRAYVEFGHLAFYETLYRCGWGFITCWVTLKLCCLLRLNQRFARLGYILRDLTKPMFYYILQALFLFLAFSILAYLLYMRDILDFCTFTKVATTLVLFALGSFDCLDDMFISQPQVTAIFFVSLMVLLNLVLVNVLVIVVMDSHDTFADADMLCSKDYELLNFLKDDINSVIRKQLGFSDKKSKS